jgi:hypothetical protein
MSHDDFEKEPIPGLPAHLPEGENILWQGAPNQASFLRSVLHIRKICFYFGLLFTWNVGTAIYDGKDVATIAMTAVLTVVMAGMVYGLAWGFARAVERTTIYTITNKRIVMRFGVALPVTFNLPFSQILSADIRALDGENGIITLSLKEHTKISWVILWPHARPWKFAKPQPALRAIGNVAGVASILANALRTAHGHAKAPMNAPKEAPQIKAKTAPAAQPGFVHAASLANT